MLLEFKCKNHKSIKEEITFSMLATKDNCNENEVYDYNGIRVLRNAAIYGPNGSGKSSFISAINFIKKLVITSVNYQPGDKFPRIAHKLSSEDETSDYSIQFVYNDIRYAYGTSILDDKVISEYLYYFPNNKQAKIFERNENNLSIGDKFRKNLEISVNLLKQNKLFLSCAANFSKVQEIEDVFLFFKENIVVYDDNRNNWLTYSSKILSENKNIKEIYLKFMKSIGSGITDIYVKYDKKKINKEDLPFVLPEELKNLLGESGEAESIDVKLNYGQFVVDLAEESKGIQKLFQMLCPIIDILMNGRILICDEIETSLHYIIALEIVKLFKNVKNNKFAQLIFTTHNTSLLDLKLFRRDQIWFTELNPDNRSTDMYSLSELKNVRKDENICKGYVMGKYGAIPMVNEKIFEIMNGNNDGR